MHNETANDETSDAGGGFAGRVVLGFESRKADEMTRLVQKFHGVPHIAPSMREIPLQSNAAALDAAHRLLTGQFDLVIVMTGVGFRYWMESLQRRVDTDRFLASLADVTTIVRGPKPAAAMKEFGITATHRVAEPHTWREVLAVVDQQVPVMNQSVCVQEYGKPNPSLVAGLEARGAHVTTLPIYRWALPEDTGPLEANARLLADQQADFVLFTSAQQCLHLMDIARQLEIEPLVRAGLRRAVVASVGPTTSEALRELDLPVDFEPSRPKLGHLVSETARMANELARRKRSIHAFFDATSPPAAQVSSAWDDTPMMRACRGQATDVTPVWLMRQAGRYMAEYRAIRSKVGFLELCRNPQLCAEVMLTAVRKLGVDAAIVFSDLLLILEPMGMRIEFTTGDGPAILNPIAEPSDVDRIAEIDDDNIAQLDAVMQAMRETRRELPGHIPLIGFAGAPFTLASYMIEGGGSRGYQRTKSLMFRDPSAWNELLGRLARSITRYLNAQIASGAQCVQLFDSWVGCLAPDDYRRHVLPHVRQIADGLTPGVPLISFATGNPALVPLLGEARPAVVGLDWRADLDVAWRQLEYRVAIQGNLDPAVLLSDTREIRRQVERILRQAAGRAGHIFNLGHGVLPDTPVENVIALVDIVHELSSRGQ